MTVQNEKYSAYRGRATNSDKLMTSWRMSDGNLISLSSPRSACHSRRQLWPYSPLSLLGTSPRTRSGRSVSPSRSWSPRFLSPSDTGQRWHQMRLNKGRVVVLCAEVIRLQSYHELDHLVDGQPVCLPHR